MFHPFDKALHKTNGLFFSLWIKTNSYLNDLKFSVTGEWSVSNFEAKKQISNLSQRVRQWYGATSNKWRETPQWKTTKPGWEDEGWSVFSWSVCSSIPKMKRQSTNCCPGMLLGQQDFITSLKIVNTPDFPFRGKNYNSYCSYLTFTLKLNSIQ